MTRPITERFKSGIERAAYDDRYFDTHMRSYPDLHGLFDDGRGKHTTDPEQTQVIPGGEREFAYWKLQGDYLYQVFETLWYLYCADRRDRPQDRISPPVSRRLPTFMATYKLGYPVREYLRALIYLTLTFPAPPLEKEPLRKFLTDWNGLSGSRKDTLTDPFRQHAAANVPGCGNLMADWTALGDPLRNALTHTFRILWWKNPHLKDSHGDWAFGFPREVLKWTPAGLRQEVDRIVSKADWEREFERLPATGVISGAELIRLLHDRLERVVESCCLAFLDHFRQRGLP